MTKLNCIHDGNHFFIGIYSSLAAIMVEINTGAETIATYVVPGFAPAGFVVYDDWDP